MSKFSKFMRNNKALKENVKYAPTKSICDENGNPIQWEFRHITAQESEDLRDECLVDVPVTGKPGQYRQKLQYGKYLRKMIAASVVEPDLHDAELQDSYGVRKPEDLVIAMVDDPGEYSSLVTFIQDLQGFNTPFEAAVKEAKN